MDVLPAYGTVVSMHCIFKEMETGGKNLMKNNILVDLYYICVIVNT